MHAHEFRDQLAEAASSSDFVSATYCLTDTWIAAGVGIESVSPVLRFMEDHPNLDYGAPGPLVHFVEQFHQRGYEEILVESIERRPTPHTLWLLRRVINGTGEGARRCLFVELLERVTSRCRRGASGES